MGILNTTPDSFSLDGVYSSNPRTLIAKALKLANAMIEEGADILDIGGESTRPGSKPVPLKEEIKRTIPIIKILAQKTSLPISIDTYKPEVALRALDAGASIINNIMGTRADKKLLQTAKNYNAAIVLMHIKGTPKTMQNNIRYTNLIAEILNSIKKAIENCLEIGIKSDRIIIDPGIGFGKTVEHNLKILNHLSDFRKLNKPILVGTSRKSFIGKILGSAVDQRVTGTMAAVSAAILNGAHIVRVHDVKEAKQTAHMIDAIVNEKP